MNAHAIGVGGFIYINGHLLQPSDGIKKFTLLSYPKVELKTINDMDSTENGKNYLESIFKSAERGMTEFNMPLTNEGKFEVLMYGIWLGTKSLDEFGIPQNYKESLSKVNDFLVDYAKRLGIPSERKAERLFVLRDEDWEKDTKSLARSNYPQTKQYLPEYLYMCFVDSPLVLYSSIDMTRKAEQIDSTNLIDFLAVFEAFYNKLIDDYKDFEADSNSYKNLANEIVNNDSANKGFYSDFEDRLKRRIKNGDKDLSLEELLMPPYLELRMIDQIVSKAAMSMDFMLPNSIGGSMANIADAYTQKMSKLFGMTIEQLNAEKNEMLLVIKPMFEQGLETRRRCATLILALNKDGDINDIKAAIESGDKLLSSFIKNINNHIDSINFAIDLNSKKKEEQPNSNANRKSSNSGCFSVIAFALILITSITFLFS